MQSLDYHWSAIPFQSQTNYVHLVNDNNDGEKTRISKKGKIVWLHSYSRCFVDGFATYHLVSS